MRLLKLLTLPAVAAAMWVSTPASPAQVSVNIGVAPVCPYGYYSSPPYECAPFGYYGPEWFSGGVFIGAGPWFHGPHDFYGHVDNRYDPHHGYHGTNCSTESTPIRTASPITPRTSMAMKCAMDVDTKGIRNKSTERSARN